MASNAKMKLTPTEQRIWDLLSDGYSHRREELIGCLYDEKNGKANLSCHITNLRGKVRPEGWDITCESRMDSTWYRRYWHAEDPNEALIRARQVMQDR